MREIILTCAIRGTEARIVLENTCTDAPQDTNARREKAGVPRSGGFGILSIRSIADKYGGMATFQRSGGRFTSHGPSHLSLGLYI